MTGNGKRGDILVIGGGISGLTAAIEAAEAGANVTVVEKEAFLGGRVARIKSIKHAACYSRNHAHTPYSHSSLLHRQAVTSSVQYGSFSEQAGNYLSAGFYNPISGDINHGFVYTCKAEY